MRDCLEYFTAWAERIGLQDIHIDAAGNFRAVLPGSGAKRLIIGSHLDTVPNAGAFDGVLGVVLGMMLAESFHGSPPPCTLEIIGFSEEEGVRFQRPFIGSTAFVHGLTDEFLNLTDKDGMTVREAITAFGIGGARWQSASADAYLEFHIEQGPVLESLGLPIALVDAIAGQTRATIEFTGHANHAGTTPMHLRHDAFCAAAEWTLFTEKTARETPGLVATIGSIKVLPDAVNIVPGSAVLSLDLRHAQDTVRLQAFDTLLEAGREIAARRHVEFQSTLRLNQKAVPLNPEFIPARNLHRMTSGAGHDAMILASKMHCAMIFLRSPGGISHHPDENVLPEDIDIALETGRAFIQNFQ
jgi:allantoate deiminase